MRILRAAIEREQVTVPPPAWWGRGSPRRAAGRYCPNAWEPSSSAQIHMALVPFFGRLNKQIAGRASTSSEMDGERFPRGQVMRR